MIKNKIKEEMKTENKIFKKRKIENPDFQGKFLFRNLDDVFRSPIWGENVLGKTYQRILLWEKILRNSLKIIRKSITVAGKISVYSIVFGIALALVYSLIPGVLSAPKFISISNKAEFDLGQFSGVTSENSTDSIQLKPAGSWNARVWTPPEDIIAYGHTSAMVGNYLYVFRGYSGNSFWRYDTVNNAWSNLADLPQPSYYGADMVYNSNSGKIYAMFGGYSQKFYSYDIENNEWTQLNDLLDTPYSGASLASDGNSIFAMRGNATTDFWEYQIGTGKWRGRAPITLTISTGGNLVNGRDGNLYAVRGGNSINFYRYNISANHWYTIADASYGGGTLSLIPSSGCSNGSCTMYGEQKGVYWNGYLYFMRSYGYMDFLRYQLSTNTWEVLTSDPTPQAVNYGSLTFNETENLIYAFRGNGTTDFWKFDPAATAGQRWIGPKQVSNTAGTLQALYLGSDVIWNKQTGVNSKLYAFQGNNTANFFVYDTTGNSWTTGAPNPGFTIRNDMKGEANSSGNIYMPRYSNASIIQIFNGTAWSAMTAQPTGATATDGAGLTFVGNDIYYIRGGANPCMYRYNSGLSTPAWGSCIATAINTSGQITTYYPYIGARITSDGTDVYMFPGDGETAFLKYTVSSGTWSNLTKTPFSQYYGSDITYDSENSKIYALAGMYKDETWEYDIPANTWRRLPNSQKFTFGRVPE
ncbi:MAG: hypothetical protein WC906_01435, partial [Parcubacteria group bacterium]